jgi:outer membrane receptor protein involved in Fe transport
VLAQGANSGTPPSPPGDSGPTQLPAISVEGFEKSAQSGYKADQSSLGKLTEPLVNTPFTVETVTRQLMDDQGVTTLREALRNVPGISLAAGEAASQGDSLTIRGFTARNDIFLDGLRDFGSYYRDPFYLQDIQVLKGPSLDPVWARLDGRHCRTRQQDADVEPVRKRDARLWLRSDSACNGRRQPAPSRVGRGGCVAP